VEKKDAPNYAAAKDSTGYFYAGYTNDIKNVLSKLNVNYSDSTMQNSWSNVYEKNAMTIVKGTNVQGKFMPNVKGMGLKDALYLLENTGIKVVVKGRGKIINQSIPPGTPLTKGFTVLVELG